MRKQSYQVIIVGAGMAGLMLAYLLARDKREVLLIEHKCPDVVKQVEQLPTRVSALNANIVKLLQQLNLWDEFHQDACAPLRSLRVWDDAGGGEMHFDSADIACQNLGHIVTNQECVRVLLAAVTASETVTFACPEKVLSVDVQPSVARVTTDKGEYSADLLVGADGAHSWLREQLPLLVRTHAYQQQALVQVVESEQPHDSVAYQSFLATGPLGVLPLAHPRRSSIVWSCHSEFARMLMALPRKEQAQHLSRALQYRMGEMTTLTQLQSFPLVERSLNIPYYHSAVLIGDAAHTIHPLAGQGANCGLQDAIWLAHCIINMRECHTKAEQLQRMLAAYWRRRQVDYAFLKHSMRAFVDAFNVQHAVGVTMRSAVMSGFSQLPMMKRRMMRIMTDLGTLPDLGHK